MKKICIFCGSSMGFDKCYAEAAAALGEVLAKNGCELYYGGGSVGLMNVIADKMLEYGRPVIGVITSHLLKMDVGHSGLTKMVEVKTMAERKSLMMEEADAFIAMPGGFGTLDELFDIAALNQLRIMDKPVAIYNVKHYFDGLLAWFDNGVKEGFIRAEHRDNIIVFDNPEGIIEKLSQFKPVTIGKWISNIKKGL